PPTSTLSLHDALPIYREPDPRARPHPGSASICRSAADPCVFKTPLPKRSTSSSKHSTRTRTFSLESSGIPHPKSSSVARSTSKRSEEHTSELQSPYDL